MNLHKFPEEFKNAIQATAEHLGTLEVFIEKDYWVTYILQRLSDSKYKDVVVFKGGTSLSKAEKCIERFSEDIDLAVITKNWSGNKIQSTLRAIEKYLTADFEEIDDKNLTSKGSKFRKTLHSYPRIVSSSRFGQATDKILLEINSFTTPNPSGLKEINSYIYDFLIDTNRNELIEKYNLSPFSILILNVERTLVEKIMGLIRASNGESPIQSIKDKIRHIYDIERILKI